MLLNRQKQLLAFLAAHGGQLGGMDFQKLLFFYCQEVELRPSYEFVPYRFGCFSFTSYADKRRLIEKGFLVDVERAWKLTTVGEKVVETFPASLKIQVERFATCYAALRGDALVALAYRKYPFYAIHSEIAARVLAKDKAALQAIQAATPSRRSPGLCTIGYEGLSLEAYINKLLVAGVTLLCDVRRNPVSRKYGFSRATLSRNCESVGLRYEHLPELGIASDLRKNLTTQTDYDRLFTAYRREALPHQTASLNKLCTWIAEGHRVALTCYEQAPRQCHRHCVAEALERRISSLGVVDHL